MKLFALLLVVLAGCGAQADDPVTPVPNTCATGFSRVNSGFCYTSFVTGTLLGPLTHADGCAATRFTGNALPPEARYAYVTIHWLFYADGVPGMKLNMMRVYSSASCSTQLTNSQASLLEQPGMTLGTVIGEFKADYILPLCAQNTLCFTVDNAAGPAGSNIVGMAVKGYYDH